MSCLLRFLLPLLFKNFKLPLKMALLSPYAQFRIFSICIVVWKVLEYKHTSLRRRSSFEELKCLLLYNRWSMSKSLNYSWHAEAFKQLAKALLCSSHPIFLLTVILKGYFRYFLSIMQVLSFSFFFCSPIWSQFPMPTKVFFRHCFLILKPWKSESTTLDCL